MTAWLERFIEHLRVERRLSEHTAGNYARDLRALAEFCSAEGLKEWKQLDNQHIRVFAARSRSGGLSPRSIQRRLSAVRTFFDYLLRETLAARDKPHLPSPNLSHNPALDVRAPKAGKHLPGTLDPDRMARLLDFQGDRTLDVRDKAIMELFYSSGLRLQELVGLDCARLDLRRGMVQVMGKGKKERLVPVGGKAVEALRKWLAERAKLLTARRGKTDPGKDNPLFVGRGGGRLSARSVQKRIEFWARRRGLDVNVHPHLFRHSFATHLLESSRDLRGVQELLGHANIATTQVYTHLDFQHLARIYDASHPRARKKS